MIQTFAEAKRSCSLFTDTHLARFVLSDQYATLTREERQALLHDSSSSTSTTLSAFVEITFDNTDNRFPTNGDEVILRRTIGLKKDEYSIDRRSASKADVGNLLEAAGFSRANPYYIVPQGRITHLTNAKDQERLDLLKEVAGTRVYEQRRSESLKIMEDTETKREKINDLLEYIESKIAELESDKEELREYYKKDKERRCLEFTIYQRELEDIAGVLDRLEEEKAKEADATSAQAMEFNKISKELVSLEAKVADLAQSIEEQGLERAQAAQERRELARELAQSEMVADEMEEVGEHATFDRNEVLQHLAEAEALINQKEAELQRLLPDRDARSAELGDKRRQLEAIRSQVRDLHSKQGRSGQFSTQAERDTWLRSQIEELRQYAQAQEERVRQTRLDIITAGGKSEEVSQQEAEISSQVESRKGQLEELAKEWRAAKEKRDAANETKK